jgi:hypothetical protein
VPKIQGCGFSGRVATDGLSGPDGGVGILLYFPVAKNLLRKIDERDSPSVR